MIQQRQAIVITTNDEFRRLYKIGTALTKPFTEHLEKNNIGTNIA